MGIFKQEDAIPGSEEPELKLLEARGVPVHFTCSYSVLRLAPTSEIFLPIVTDEIQGDPVFCFFLFKCSFPLTLSFCWTASGLSPWLNICHL